MQTMLTLTHPAKAFPSLMQWLMAWYGTHPPGTVQMSIAADAPESETKQMAELLQRYFPHVVVQPSPAGGPDGTEDAPTDRG
jgi:hypothetical protein